MLDLTLDDITGDCTAIFSNEVETRKITCWKGQMYRPLAAHNRLFINYRTAFVARNRVVIRYKRALTAHHRLFINYRRVRCIEW